MTILLTLLSVALSVAILAGAFYLAKYVVSAQHEIVTLKRELVLASESIVEQLEHIAQLNHQIEQINYEAQMNGQRSPVPRAWEPKDLLNTGER